MCQPIKLLLFEIYWPLIEYVLLKETNYSSTGIAEEAWYWIVDAQTYGNNDIALLNKISSYPVSINEANMYGKDLAERYKCY
jgi:sialic acid synthase SpsE